MSEKTQVKETKEKKKQPTTASYMLSSVGVAALASTIKSPILKFGGYGLAGYLFGKGIVSLLSSEV
jgi:hypothetical protein